MRRTSRCLLILLVLSTAAGTALAERDVFPLLDYRSESWFLPQTPGVTGGPVAGLFNPAAFAHTGRAGADFWWDDRDVRNGLDNYGLAFGSGLNFAMNTMTWGDAVESYKTYDYQLGLAGGSRRATVGLAYRWARGETARQPRQQALVAGFISRPSRYWSGGASAAFSLESAAAQFVFDLGLRPLGRDWLTVFADWAVNDDHRFFKDGSLGAGLEIRPVRGLHFGGKARDRSGGGIDYSLMVGLTLGAFNAAAMPLYDAQDENVASAFLLRSHPPFGGLPVGKPLFGGKTRFYALDLQNRVLTYQKARYFDNERLAWLDLLRLLDALRDDKSYDGLALNLAGFRGRPSLMWELRQKLLELQAAGKEIHVHTDRSGPMVTWVAAAADRVTIDPQGMVALPGFALSRSYLKGTLEKIGVGFQEFRYFKYKSAVESLSRDHMSEADREQRQRIVDVLDEAITAGVAGGRHLSTADLRTTMDEQTILLPKEALAAGLVDAIMRWDQYGLRLQFERGIKLDGRPPTGLGRPGWDDQWGRPKRIPVVYAVGPCAMDTGIRGRATSAYLRGLKRDPDVAAVVLRVDSPGGFPLPSDLVADAVRQLRAAGKPVIVSQGDVAASGGYWLSMDGGEILTTPVTITGSIGVIGGWVWDDGIAGSLGVSSDAVSSGPRADLFTTVNIPLLGALPRRAMNDEELARTRELIMGMYDDFVTAVAQGRGLPEETVRTLAEGRVWMGGDAVERGLCDRFGTLGEAIETARSQAGVPDWQQIELVEFPPRKLFNMPNFFPRMPSLLPFSDRADAWLAQVTGVVPAPEPAPLPTAETLPGLTPLDMEFVRTLAAGAGLPVMMVGPDVLPEGWGELD